ncbi:MAG: redoxin domain-containing protein [Clostridiales bacterium]|nr:redoxin domain-containing protein [Clostridiales bacterium]
MKKVLGLIATFALVLSLCLGFAMLSGCAKPEPISYTVSVVDSNGSAVSEVTVELVLDGEAQASGVTGSDGKAVMQASPDVYEVKLSNLPQGMAVNGSYSTDKQGSEVNVTLKDDGYRINVLHEGEHVAGIEVYLQTASGETVASGITTKNGAIIKVAHAEYIVALDLPAPYVFVANTEEGSNGYYTVSQEKSSVTINLNVQDVTYSATVRTHLGEVVEGAEIEVLKRGEVVDTLTTDGDGRIEFTLPAYAYELRVVSSLQGYSVLGANSKTLKIVGEDVTINVAPEGTEAIEYSLTVDNIGGRLMEGVKVAFYLEDTFVSHANTNSDGVAIVYLPAATYNVAVEDLDLGYAMQGSDFVELTAGNSQGYATLTTEVIKDQTPDKNFTYSLGDVMYELVIETTEGELTLSEILEEKKLVVINLWATWCGPCRSEFPALYGAYLQYSDVVEVIAVSTSDSLDACYDFSSDEGLNGMPFAEDNGIYSMLSRFSSGGIPTTVFVDRYGVITEAHTGSIVVQGEWARIFDRYIADDYVQQIGGSGGGGEPLPDNSGERIKPDIDNPSVESVAQALNGQNCNFTYYFESEDSSDFEYAWPWLPNANGNGIHASNVRQSDKLLNFTFANIHSDFTAKAGDVITFDYNISTEFGYDVLYVLIDNQIMQSLSGTISGTCFAYVVPVDGEYTLSLCYNKDRTTAYEGEKVEISNMRILTEDAINVPTSIFRYAAFGANENYTATNSEMKYEHYVDVVFNAEDGFYHVYNENGPLLMAVITQYGTQWNPNTTIFNLADDGYCVFNGVDYKEIIAGTNSFAHLAAWSDIEGYVPVNEEMADVLKLIAANLGDQKGTYNEFTGEANEVWLEMCVYYDYYGPAGGEMENPIKGLATHTAIELHEGDNHVVINKTPVPRGIYHVFTAEEAGFYEFKSTDNAQSQAWIMREVVDEFGFKSYVMQGTNGSSSYFGPEGYMEDFRFEVNLKQGEKVYLLITMYAHPATGDFNVRVTHYGNESSGELIAAGEGPHVFDDETGEWYAANCIDFMLGDDGYYHHKLYNGSQGGLIYLNLTGTTYMFSNGEVLADFITGRTTVDDGVYHTFNFEDVQIGGVYGEDWTSVMEEYLAEAEANEGNLEGFVAVDEQLYEIMLFFSRSIFTHPTDESILSPNSWLLACSYAVV